MLSDLLPDYCPGKISLPAHHAHDRTAELLRHLEIIVNNEIELRHARNCSLHSVCRRLAPNVTCPGRNAARARNPSRWRDRFLRVVHCRTGIECEPGRGRPRISGAPHASTQHLIASPRRACAAPHPGHWEHPPCRRVPGAMQHARSVNASRWHDRLSARGALQTRDRMRVPSGRDTEQRCGWTETGPRSY
jgi:hypothetical protein